MNFVKPCVKLTATLFRRFNIFERGARQGVRRGAKQSTKQGAKRGLLARLAVCS